MCWAPCKAPGVSWWVILRNEILLPVAPMACCRGGGRELSQRSSRGVIPGCGHVTVPTQQRGRVRGAADGGAPSWGRRPGNASLKRFGGAGPTPRGSRVGTPGTGCSTGRAERQGTLGPTSTRRKVPEEMPGWGAGPGHEGRGQSRQGQCPWAAGPRHTSCFCLKKEHGVFRQDKGHVPLYTCFSKITLGAGRREGLSVDARGTPRRPLWSPGRQAVAVSVGPGAAAKMERGRQVGLGP